SVAPCAASVFAMPQAIEWSFATPMISPRLPSISWVMPSRIQPLEHDGCIGAAETERVRQHAIELHVVAALAQDRDVREGGVEGLDVGALANEAVLHHQQRIDRLLHAGGAERMAGQRLGRRDRRDLR